MPANLSPWNSVPSQDIHVGCPVEFDLSASSASYPVMPTSVLQQAWGRNLSQTKLIIKKVTIVYTETTASEGLNIIQIGSHATPGLYGTVTTPNGSLVGSETTADQDSLIEPRVITDNAIWITSSGGSGANGKCFVFLTLSQDYSQWVGFDETSSSP